MRLIYFTTIASLASSVSTTPIHINRDMSAGRGGLASAGDAASSVGQGIGGGVGGAAKGIMGGVGGGIGSGIGGVMTARGFKQ